MHSKICKVCRPVSLVTISVLFILLINLVLSGCLDPEGDVSIGKRIYEQGILEDGSALTGISESGTVFTGEMVSCARCHRKSGYGSVEGNIYVPPITAPILFNDRLVENRDMLRSLFQEEYGKNDWAKLRNLSERPAYNQFSVLNVLKNGIDVQGNLLDPIMPKYQLDDVNYRHLFAYLNSLSAISPDGVLEDTIHFATIITDDISESDRNIFIEIINTYVQWKNKNIIAQVKAAGRVPHHKGGFIDTYKYWKIHFWSLKDDKNLWEKQLDNYYADQPVFAMISGFSNQSWAPIHEYCESHKIPVLFPNVRIPFLQEDNYNLYLTTGIYGESKELANHLIKKNGKVILLQGTGERATEFGQSFYNVYQKMGRTHLIVREDISSINNKTWFPIITDPQASDTIRIVLASDQMIDEELLPAGNHSNIVLYTLSDLFHNHKFPGYVTGCSCSPYTSKEERIPRSYRIHSWMRSRGIDISNEVIQFNTYFALSIADSALDHMVGYYSRQHLIERVEHEVENNLNPGVYPRLSLGPGQRFAFDDCKIVYR